MNTNTTQVLAELEAVVGESPYGFTKEINELRWRICANSTQYHAHIPNCALTYKCNMIARFDRYDDDKHREGNERRWEDIRAIFFGDETPQFWNEI